MANFCAPSGLGGLSLGTILLALLGNAMMLPRALLVGDTIWLAGTAWACAAMWLQTLSLHLGRSPVTGLSFVPAPLFAVLTAALFAYLVGMVVTDRRVKEQTTRGEIQIAPTSTL